MLPCVALMSKPNWSCNRCGMYSSRRSSVKRHIRDQHAWDGASIPFADYVAGIRNGYYPTRDRPQFKSTIIHNQENELDKEIDKRAAKKFLDTLPSPMVDLMINSSIPTLLSSPKFQSSSIPGLNTIAKIYFGRVNAKFSDEIFGLVQSPCQICGFAFRTIIKYGDDIQPSEFRHTICEEQAKLVPPAIKSLIGYQDHPLFRIHNKMKFKSQILQWTLHNCALLATKIGNLPNELIVSDGGNSSMQVMLNSKKEAMVSLNNLDLFSFDWLDDAIDLG